MDRLPIVPIRPLSISNIREIDRPIDAFQQWRSRTRTIILLIGRAMRDAPNPLSVTVV